MKKLLLSIALLTTPFLSYAGNSLKNTCSNLGLNYIENVSIVTISGAKAEINNSMPIFGGIEIKSSNNPNPRGIAIGLDSYFLYNVAKSAFLTDSKVNICISNPVDNQKIPYPYLFGVEIIYGGK